MLGASSKNMAILREMVTTDFKVRYQGSVLGYLWSLLRPLFMFCILYFVFTFILPIGKDVPHYAVQLFIGIVFWNFFTEATSIGMGSIVSSSAIIRKISIPRFLIVVASSVSALINLALNLIVLFIFVTINGVEFRPEWLLLLPLIIEVFILAQGLGFFLSAANVRFRDVQYIWELIVQAGFYATPIIYTVTASKIPEELQKFFLLNPMAQMIQDGRWAIIGGDTVTLWSIVGLAWALTPLCIVFIVACVGWFYFKRKAHTFAEDI